MVRQGGRGDGMNDVAIFLGFLFPAIALCMVLIAGLHDVFGVKMSFLEKHGITVSELGCLYYDSTKKKCPPKDDDN